MRKHAVFLTYFSKVILLSLKIKLITKFTFDKSSLNKLQTTPLNTCITYLAKLMFTV